jgi:LysM repeat protein
MAVALLALALTLFAFVPASSVQARGVHRPLSQEPGTNLVANPGFEGIGQPVNNSSPNSGNWTRDTFTGAQYGEIFTPEGWVTWWQEGEFKRPECKVVPNEHPFNADPNRIYQGYYSGMCFTFFGKQNAGYYQVVRNIPVGSVVEGSFYAHAWACSQDSPPESCGDPYSFYFQVGIDPNGGTDPFSQSIVWSSPYYHYDTYGLVGPVQATVGESGAATLFLRAYGKWALKHNDAYMDNPSLKLISQGETPTPTPPPPPPTSEASEAPEAPPTPQFTPTPRLDGAIVHTIVEGDTLFGLAITYGVDLQQIYDLNNLGPDSLLQIGQDIVIATTGEGVATPTPAPVQETPQPEAPATEAPQTTPGADSGSGTGSGSGGAPAAPPEGKASVCVLAFYDSNSDMFRQPDGGEMLLPNAQVTLLGRSGPIDTRTTDGISEPWCFDSVDPGNYVVQHSPPPGYETTSGSQQSFILSDGQVLNLELPYVRDANAEPGENPASPESPGPDTPNPSNPDASEPTGDQEEAGGGVTNVLNVVLRVSGFIVLALAIAVLVLFVLSRRAA